MMKLFWENVDEKLIFVNLEVETNEEVFEIMGGKLIEEGRCEKTYIQALKDREKVFPTGVLVQDTGVAIPHTDPEHVKQSSIAIATLKDPVKFYHMGTNPEEGVEVEVSFVIMLAIAGREHLDVLQKAIQLIQDQEVLQKLIKAENAKEIIEIVKAKEEKDNENI